MDYWEIIKNKLQEKLNQNHKDLILSYYKAKLKQHNNEKYCSCDYCIKKHEYVRYKRYLKVLNSRYDSYEISHERDYKLEMEWLNNYYFSKHKIRELKLEKDKLMEI